MDIDFQSLALIAWSACPPLFLYGLFRRIERLQYATALLFFLLLINVFLGLNAPNPDNVRIVEVISP